LVSSWNIEHWSISIKSAYSFSNSSWFHKMSKNHLYFAIGITYKDQFLLPPNFSHITLEAFLRFESNHISKTLIFFFYPSHQQVKKSSQNTKITKFAYAPRSPRSIPFAPKLFPHHIEGICEVWVQPHFPDHDFRFSPHTPPNHKIKPNHQTWLCANHAEINSFFPQTFPTSRWRYLWGLSPTTIPKPGFSFFTPHTTKSQNQAKTPKSPNLAIHQPYQDEFLLLPAFSHITLEAFVKIVSSHI